MNASGLWVRAAVVTALASLAALTTACPPPPPGCDGGESRACPPDVVDDEPVSPPDAIDVPDAVDAHDAMDAYDATDVPDTSDVRDVQDVQDVQDAMDVPTDSTPQATCAPIEAFGASEVAVDGSVQGETRINYNRCSESTPGGEALYRFEVPGPTPLGVLFSTAGSTREAGPSPSSALDTTLAIYRGCAVPTLPSQEVACNDNAGASTGSVVRAVLAPGAYSVAVDTVGTLASSGAFVLHARTFAPAPNPQCNAEAPELGVGPAVTAAVGRGGAYPSPPCRRREGGATVFYRINLAATATGRVTVTPTSAGWQPMARIVTSCLATSMCLADGVSTATGDGGATAQPLTLLVPPSTDRPATLWLAVSARSEPAPDGATATVQLEVNP